MKFIISLVFIILLSLDALAEACDYKVEIVADGNEFDSQNFKWRMRATKIEGKSTNITGTAEIESNGKAVKSYKPWTSESIAKQKTSNEYSPNLKPGTYEITAEIKVDCDDTNKDNNIDKKEVTIKGDEAAKKEEEPMPAAKKTKKIEQADLQDASSERTASEPKSRQPSSKPKKSTEEFDNVIELKAQNSQKTKEIKSISSNAARNPEVVYESSNEKAKGWIMIFLLTLSILLNIVLIWRR